MADPGRKRNEIRTAEFVAVGETVLLDSVLWTVAEFDHVDDWAEPWYSVIFHLTREQGGRKFTRTLNVWPADEITVRNHLTPQS